ncbi:ABC transporter substrate-binding protein [Vibrio kyushuensis]|uniref:ABC transporter substrate-binding protein n=1 Tax=Vibrio kyushuensis TaxID=2910249 RepID=UPI003D13CBEB
MKIKLSLAVMLLLIGGGLFYQIDSTNQKSAPTGERITIAVSQTPLSSPFIIASHLKLFEKQNVNIELIPCMGGVACAKSLFNNEVDFATASESVVMFESFNQDDLSLISCFVESDNDVKLLTLKDNNINSIDDLIGKRVGIIKASASEFYFDSLLRANNLQSLELIRVYMSPQQLSEALFSGDVDAVSIWEPHGYLIMSGSKEVVNLSLDGIYHLTFNLLTRDSEKKERMEASVKILTAVDQSIHWINQNPEEAREIIAGFLDIPKSQLEWSWEDYTFRLSIGNALLSNLQLQARWAIEAKLVEGEMPDYRKILSPNALEQVLHKPVSYQ